MADIKISNNGDLQLVQLTVNNTVVKDLVEERNLISLLIKRALLTPKGYISITELKNGSLTLKDNNYGDEIYSELSEGLTANFLSRVRSHITSAIKEAQLSSLVNSIDINIIEAHTIQILVVYTNGNNNIIEIIV